MSKQPECIAMIAPLKTHAAQFTTTWRAIAPSRHAPHSCVGVAVAPTSGSFQFVVPTGVSTVRAIAVGGGKGGINGHQPGGVGGYINWSNIAATSGQSIHVNVGIGGTGAVYQTSNSIIVIANNSAGGASSFGSYIVAGGGSTWGTNNTNSQFGCDGGTGSGANCWYHCPVGTVGRTGGSGGNNDTSTPGSTPQPNGGQKKGNTAYSACLHLAKPHQLTTGAGGPGGQLWCMPGTTYKST